MTAGDRAPVADRPDAQPARLVPAGDRMVLVRDGHQIAESQIAARIARVQGVELEVEIEALGRHPEAGGGHPGRQHGCDPDAEPAVWRPSGDEPATKLRAA